MVIVSSFSDSNHIGTIAFFVAYICAQILEIRPKRPCCINALKLRSALGVQALLHSIPPSAFIWFEPFDGPTRHPHKTTVDSSTFLLRFIFLVINWPGVIAYYAFYSKYWGGAQCFKLCHLQSYG